MRKLIRFRWPLDERGRGKRKNSCYIEPIDVFCTLTAKHCGDHTADCSNGVLIEGGYNDVRIRRLTPREVWRLQGFPDEYFDKAAAVISDTQLYRTAGNAVSVPVAKAIGLRLKEIEQCEDINSLTTTD